MDLRQVRERCEARIRELDFRGALDVQELTAELARRRGRPIHLLPMPAGPANPSGLCISAASAEYIFYESGSAGIHREHIILHEIGHLVFGHSGALNLTGQTAALLTPSIDPDVARSMLGRHDYADEQEREAEMFATLILAKSGGRTESTRFPAETGEVPEVLSQLRDLLGLTVRGTDG
jgi:hypothetical protein